MQRLFIIDGNRHLKSFRNSMVGGVFAVVLFACTEQDLSPSAGADHKVASTDVVAIKQKTQRPNLIIIMADDLGYSDIGAYGGEIETPNIDALALSGVKMVNFYSSLTCSPSRAMLMSGADNHLAGMGNMDETLADNQLGLPGYEGHLNARVLSLAEALKVGGYKTYMAGKWHLGMTKELGPAARGFDDSFALLFGGASHYDNSFGPDAHRTEALYRDNGELLNKAPDGFFSSDYYTSRIIQSIDGGIEGSEPFFAYLSFTAPHWPLQFPPDYAGKYAQTYDVGWNQIRAQRLARLEELDLVPKASDMAPMSAQWDALSDEQKALSAKKMEVYAAMVDDMDVNIGRLIKHLKVKGLYDNTVIVFLSDNGSASWGNDAAPPAVRDWANGFSNDFENVGQPNSFILYGKRWASVSSTPFQHYKGNATEGGIRVPMVVRLPDYLQDRLPAGRSESLSGIEDIMPTFLELAGINSQALELKSNQVPITGRSFLSNGNDETTASAEGKAFVGREIWGKQGLRAGDWKLINQPSPYGNGNWQLFHLKTDLAEQLDLASSNPQKLQEMLSLWQQYVEQNNVVLPEGKFRVRDPGAMPTQ